MNTTTTALKSSLELQLARLMARKSRLEAALAEDSEDLEVLLLQVEDEISKIEVDALLSRDTQAAYAAWGAARIERQMLVRRLAKLASISE
jgi:hypothetical protein